VLLVDELSELLHLRLIKVGGRPHLAGVGVHALLVWLCGSHCGWERVFPRRCVLGGVWRCEDGGGRKGGGRMTSGMEKEEEEEEWKKKKEEERGRVGVGLAG